MIACKIFTAKVMSKEEENLTYNDLHRMALAKVNESDINSMDVINIVEDCGSYEVRPRPDSSNTWYTRRWFSLTVYYRV